jgi:hypothetical protein
LALHLTRLAPEVRVLERTVPPALPGVLFASGGLSEEEARGGGFYSYCGELLLLGGFP